MNIVLIAIKEIKTSFRNPTTIFFALGLPVILILVFGMIFVDSFKSTVPVGKMNVLYTEQPNYPFSKEFSMLIKEANNSGIHFEKAESTDDSKRKVQQNMYDGYVEITHHGINLYQSDSNQVKGNVLQGILNTFLDQSNLTNATKVDPSTLMSLDIKSNYVKETTLNSNKQPSAIDYFSVSMTTMIILFGAANAIHLISGERKRNTAYRLVSTPISRLEIFLGKILGTVIIGTLYFLIVIMISKYVFQADWGDHLSMVIIVLSTEVFFVTTLGIIIDYLTKSTKAANTLIQLIAIVATSFSGTFYKMNDISGIFYLNPLNWVNKGILDIIYANDFSAAILAISLNIGISVLFILITITLLRRREGL